MKKRIISIVLVIATLFAMSSIAFSTNAATVSKTVAVSNAVVSKPVADSNAIATKPIVNSQSSIKVILFFYHNYTGYAYIIWGWRKNVGEGLRMRTHPSTGSESKIVYNIPKNEMVYVTYKTTKTDKDCKCGWAFVHYKNYVGWVASDYLRMP